MPSRQTTTARPVFKAAPTLAFAPVRKDAPDVPEIPVQSDPTGPYGVAVARLRCGGSQEVSGTPTDHIVGFNLSASVRVTTRLCGRRFDLKLRPGSLALTPAGADCVSQAGGPSTCDIVRVSTECFALAKSQLSSPCGSALVEQVDGRDDTLFRMSRALVGEAAAGHPNGALFWSSMADALIRRLTETHLSAGTPPSQGSLNAHDFKRLEAYIEANLAEPLDLDGLATIVDCDRFHFARRFRAAVGVTPHRYVMRRRLDRARAMMRARSSSLADIALTTGFYDQSHLSNWIRRVYGATPRQLMRG